MIDICFYTETGQNMAKSRSKAFCEIAPDRYAKEYDEELEKLQKWLKHSSDPKLEIFLVGKNVDPKPVIGLDVGAVINRAFQKRLPLPKKYSRGSFLPKGWNIKVVYSGSSCIIDPSVARFAFTEKGLYKPKMGREVFKEAVQDAVTTLKVPPGKI